MYVIGLLLFSAVYIFMVLVGVDFIVPKLSLVLYDMPTTLYFIVTIASVTIMTGGGKTFIAAVNALISKKYSISAYEKEKAIRLFKLLSKSVVYASVLITFVSFIIMLTDLSDLSKLGPNMAVAINAIVFGAFINLILINPAINILESRYNAEEKTVISEKQVIDKLLELCYKQGISPEEIINADEIQIKKLN